VVGALAVVGAAFRYPRARLDKTGQLVRRVLAQHNPA
jgi:hypothetical protein